MVTTAKDLYEQYWIQEIEKRVLEMNEGNVKLISWDSVRAKLRKKLGASIN